MSPGGVVASAERTAAYRDQIETAAERHGVDPDTLEAVIFLESAGRPDVIAGPTPESASGLAQIIPSTATDLLGMSVDLPQSIAITERITQARTPAQAERLRAQRAAIDQRFDPAAAIEGAARYLEIAHERFGGDDLAIASYHMGIGNLETVLRAYAGDDPTARLSYAQVYFDSGPDSHAEAYELLQRLRRRVGRLPVEGPRLARDHAPLARRPRRARRARPTLATNKATLEEVFHPENETTVFEDPGAIEDATEDGELLPLPDEPGLGWEPDPDIGELAEELDQSPDLYRALRPEALATLTYLAGLARNIERRGDAASGDQRGPRSRVPGAPHPDQPAGDVGVLAAHHRLVVRHPPRLRVDAARREAFQFVLDRLRALALLDYAFEPGAIHVTVSSLGAELLRVAAQPEASGSPSGSRAAS